MFPCLHNIKKEVKTMSTMVRGDVMQHSQRIRITSKRQLTIPKAFFDALGFDKQAECILKGNEIIIKPVSDNSGYFASQILKDLVSQGYEGKELIAKFEECQKKVRPAIENLLDEANRAATGEAKSYSYDDVFGAEE